MMKNTNQRDVSHLVKQIPRNSVGVELGVWRGETSKQFQPKCAHLYLVDAWAVDAFDFQTSEFGTQEAFVEKYANLVGSTQLTDFDQYYQRVYENVVEMFQGKNVTVFRGTTDHFFETHADLKVDWIYVDAAHDYSGCLNDLTNSMRLIKQNGFILGDDYKGKMGVRKAVDQFVKQNNLTFKIIKHGQYKITL